MWTGKLYVQFRHKPGLGEAQLGAGGPQPLTLGTLACPKKISWRIKIKGFLIHLKKEILPPYSGCHTNMEIFS